MADAKKDKKALKREKKLRALAKAEEQRAKDEAMQQLRERVRQLLSHNVPPRPAEQVAGWMPELAANPWRLVHDPCFTRLFLDQLARVLKEHADVPPEGLAAAVKRAKAASKASSEASGSGADPDSGGQAAADGAGGGGGEAAAPAQAADAGGEAPAASATGPAAADAGTAGGEAGGEPQGEAAAAKEGEAEAAAEPPAPTQAEIEQRLQRQLLEIYQGLQGLSRWAVAQPAFFTTDVATMRQWVRVLHLLIDKEGAFSSVLGILFPTIKNQRLSELLAEADIIEPMMQFVECHMPEAAPAASAGAAAGDAQAAQAAPAEGADAAEVAEQAAAAAAEAEAAAAAAAVASHKYSNHTFRTLMNSIKMLSVAPQLRAKFKERSRPYLHLRRLAMGSIRGFTPVQQEFATRCLRYFVEDGDVERATGAELAPRDVNAAMLRYWKGHVHLLFCEPAAGDGEEGGAAAAAAGRRRKTVQRGFADQNTLDAFNRNARRRLRRA